ncbi:MAG: SDR family oxidoreductase [Pseudomonadales bacterium]|nr:SDR family oxidoreductase [Pseudomonadales bacterium]MCP5186103.1 SDR family oxidoreductase [Pseudomonadales bacterium]
MSLSGKRILVTGCGGGIGRAVSRLLGERGATLVLSDLELHGAATAHACKARYLSLDVTQEHAWRSVAATILDEFGGLDGVVNVAGVILMQPLEATTLAEYRRIQAVNHESVFLSLRHTAPLLRHCNGAHGASVVNFSSIYGLGGQSGFSAYSAAKGAVRLLSKAAAVEFASQGDRIRVNSVHPGPIDTPLARGPIEQLVQAGRLSSVEAGMQGVASRYPGGRIGLPDDVAGVVAFLLSDDARFLNGVELPVDYGITAHAQ